MPSMLGFWSYVHADDEVDFGRVSQLARDIVANYEAIRAEKIRLFLDTDELKWGDAWRDEVDEALSRVAFFIPVLTPRYFTSLECRRELQFFLDRTAALGIPQLVLPILYIDVPGIHDDVPPEPLMATVRARQWEPWQHLRFKDRESGEYRENVSRLAALISDRVAAVESIDVASVVAEMADDDEALGTLDRMATLEEVMPRWNETMQKIAAEVATIGEIMRRGTDELNGTSNQGKGFAARLAVARRVASELEKPVVAIEALAQTWVADLDSIDSGIQAILDRIQEAYAEGPEETTVFLTSIRDLSLAANQGLGGAATLVQAVEGLVGFSKDMRPALRRLKTSLLSMAEARAITDDWLNRIDATGILSEVG